VSFPAVLLLADFVVAFIATNSLGFAANSKRFMLAIRRLELFRTSWTSVHTSSQSISTR